MLETGKGMAEKRNMVVMEESMWHIMGKEEGSGPAERGYLATNREFEKYTSGGIQRECK
jgi:hypothetical protein